MKIIHAAAVSLALLARCARPCGEHGHFAERFAAER